MATKVYSIGSTTLVDLRAGSRRTQGWLVRSLGQFIGSEVAPVGDIVIIAAHSKGTKIDFDLFCKLNNAILRILGGKFELVNISQTIQGTVGHTGYEHSIAWRLRRVFPILAFIFLTDQFCCHGQMITGIEHLFQKG